MLVTGIDPGETVGWATLYIEPRVRPRLVDRGAWTQEEAFRAVESGIFREHLVAVEKAVAVFPYKVEGGPAMATSIAAKLLDAAYLGGELRGLLRAAGGRAEYVRLTDAYRAMGVKVGAQRGRSGAAPCETVARQTARLLSMVVDGWPKVSNQHERDAAIDALYAARTT